LEDVHCTIVSIIFPNGFVYESILFSSRRTLEEVAAALAKRKRRIAHVPPKTRAR
jgi:hypothetical protein